MTDFIFMVKGTSHMFITGPDVVKTVTGEDVTQEELGGAMTHATKSGVAHVRGRRRGSVPRAGALPAVVPARRTTSRTRRTSSPTDDPERACDDIVALIPDSPNKPYDMKEVIARGRRRRRLLRGAPVLGDEHRVRLRPHRRPRRRHRRQPAAGARRHPRHRRVGEGGALRAHLRRVQHPARDVRRRARASCPGTDQEYGGIIRHGAKLLYAYCEATVPRVQIITRKAYGGAYVVMNSKSIGADLAFAWPSAEIAVMGPQGAVNIIFRKEIEAADDPSARRAELIDEYTERFANPYNAAERGYVDDVIDPRDTRRVLVQVARHAAHEAGAAAAAQARQHAAVSGVTRPVLRVDPADATREEVAAIVAAVRRARVRRRCAPPRRVDEHAPRVGARAAAAPPAAPGSSAVRGGSRAGSAAARAPDAPRWPSRRRGAVHASGPTRWSSRSPPSPSAAVDARGVGDHEVTTTGPHHVAASTGSSRTPSTRSRSTASRRRTRSRPSFRTLARPPGGCSRRSRPPTTSTSARPSAAHLGDAARGHRPVLLGASRRAAVPRGDERGA